MSVLTNPRHEHFSNLVARGTPATRAYIEAGYSENGAAPSACALLKSPKVAARIAELRETIGKAVVEKTAYDRAKAMEEAEEALKLAMDKENPGAAVAAITLRAKLTGLLVEKKEIRTGALDDLSAQERDAAIDAIRRELASRSDRTGAVAELRPPQPLSSVH